MEPGTKLDLIQTRDACVNSFAVYARLMQDDEYFDPVHELLCNWTQMQIEKLEQQVEVKGTCNGRLLYVMPRGSLKSTIVTKHLNTWLVIRRFYKFNDDSTRILLAGNTFTNAKKKLNGLRGVFSVGLFKALFPELLPRTGRHGDQWSDEGACIPRTSSSASFDEATFECGGTNTTLTGRHYNVICEDDTTAPDVDEMKEDLTRPSRDTIEKAIGFHKASMSLFVPKEFRLSIVVSTRWAMEDLVSYVQDKEEYKFFDMPAENKDGTSKFEIFYDAETREIIRKRVGDYMYSMLYLNKPLDDSLRVFKSTDMHWVGKEAVPTEGRITIAVDPAISEKDDACESAITVNQHVLNAKGERHEYWHEDPAGHMLPFALAKRTLQIADKYDTEDTPVVAIIVEQEAYQAALKYIMINMMNHRKKKGQKVYSIVKAKRGNKEIRIEGMQPAFQQRRIHFVRGALSDQTESQLLQFPGGKLVDIIDSWSMHRKVWRSENFDDPAKPEEVVDEFEEAYAEVSHRNRVARGEGSPGLNLMGSVDIGVGLDRDGKMYY